MTGLVECRYYGRDFTAEEMALLRALIAVDPQPTRAALSREFCRRIGWFKPDGALKDMMARVIEQRQRWVIDADLKAYFDSIPHTHLRSFLDLRIKDGVVRRMIDKWLKAGVLEKDAVHRPVAGTPQGGVISPLLSERSDNIGYGNLMIMGT